MDNKDIFKAEEAVYSKENWIKGELQDTIIDRDGNETVLPADHNLVVSNCSTLIAALFKSIWDNSGDSDDPGNTRSGIRYWAIGCAKKDDDGNEIPVVDPIVSDSQLQNEFFRKEIQRSDINFVTADGVVSKEPTNRLQIKITVNYDEANMDENNNIGEWVEMGIFAGPGATETLATGYMMNRKVHAKIGKTGHIKVQRTLTFTF